METQKFIILIEVFDLIREYFILVKFDAFLKPLKIG